MNLPDPSPITAEELARLGLARFVALDLETTGFDPSRDHAIELGAVRYEGGVEVAQFSELIGIDEDLPPFITRLTSITDDDLMDRPRIGERIADFLAFIGSDPIVGQNIKFDTDFIEGELRRLPDDERPVWRHGPVFDTLPLARTFFPTLTSYGLGALARQLGVDLDNAHRAVHDARATAEVLLELVRRARRTPFGELAEMSRILGGAAMTVGSLIDGLMAIGPGEAGADLPVPMRDNRIGDWDSEPDRGTMGEEYDDAWFHDFFGDEGPLSGQVPGYRMREGQVQMALDVHTTLKQGGALFAEGGTGTGKSFAYLLPALLHARGENGRVMVSTHTKHLQSQLFDRDLPQLNEALGGTVRAVLLKGRGNYICRRRYENLVAHPDSLEPAERAALLPLVRWLARTRTGDIHEVPGFMHGLPRGLWPKISSDSGFCTSRVCRASQGCFLHRIRMSAQRAHVVLINHALLFSDLASQGGVLGEYDRVVFDEAHHVEKVAANHLGITYSHTILRAVLLQLHDAPGKKGVLLGLRAWAPLMATPIERGSSGEDPLEMATEAVAAALASGDEFGSQLEALVRNESENGDYERRVRYRSGETEFAPIRNIIDRHRSSLVDLDKALNKVAVELDEMDRGPLEGDDLLGEFRRLSAEVHGMKEMFERLTGPEEENTVFWYEAPRTFGRGSVRLYGAPLDIGRVLNKDLYPRVKAVIFTSATIAVNESFNYIAGRLGRDDASGKIYPSPFDMRGQLYIAIADFVGDPKRELRRFTNGVADLARRLPNELDAGTLVLFTSQKMLAEAWDQAAPLLEKDGWLTLAQGLGGSQAELLTRFRNERRSVLFGVDSFWEGIDVPGESLELAIIARLPFDVPTDPLVAARSEKIQQEGGNPFMEYTLPEAALKLRQGIGRLIRTTEDVGVAVICDPRLIRSRWGRVMVNSLPVQPVPYRTYEEMAADLRHFLEGDEE